MLDAEVEVECPSDFDDADPADIDVVVPYPEFADVIVLHAGTSDFAFTGARYTFSSSLPKSR